MKKKIIYESVKGLNRVENQDNFLIIKDDCFSIMFVFDGVGSALNGKKATELCHEFISRMYRLFYQSEMINLSELMFETNQYLLSQNFSTIHWTVNDWRQAFIWP